MTEVAAVTLPHGICAAREKAHCDHDSVGAIIELINGPFGGTRLMDVRYEGETMMMFTDDMETYTVALKNETAGFKLNR